MPVFYIKAKYYSIAIMLTSKLKVLFIKPRSFQKLYLLISLGRN